MSNILRLFAVFFVAVLVALLLGPATPLESNTVGIDKVAHFGAFGGLLWSFGVLFPRQPRVLLALYALAFGAATEITQGVLGRDASWFDLLADGLGVSVALLVWGAWRRFKPRAAITEEKKRQALSFGASAS